MQIVLYPHPTLRRQSKPIRRVDSELRSVVRQMFDLMYAARGIGLAANQVDLPLRLFIVNLAANPEEGEELVFINPVLSRPKGSDEHEEGCLSFPELYGPVRRPKQVRVNAYALDGRELDVTLDGMLARVVQHEFDHLEGVLFIDRLSPAARRERQEAIEEFELVFRGQRATGEIPGDLEIAQRLQQWEQQYC